MHLTKITISVFVKFLHQNKQTHKHSFAASMPLCCYVNPCEGQASLGVTGGALSCCLHTLCDPAASLLHFVSVSQNASFPWLAQMGKWALPLACGVWHLRNCAGLYTVLHVHHDLTNKPLTMST